MSRNVRLCSPDDRLRDVARKMKEADAGALAVGETSRLIGMITDRDLVVRALAEGKGPDNPVREVMTRLVYYAFDDEDLDQAVATMSGMKIRHLPVLNHRRQMVGILSLGEVCSSAEAPLAVAAPDQLAQHADPRAQT